MQKGKLLDRQSAAKILDARSVTVFTSPFRICILAGDISPVDVLTHIPIICEDHHIPYIYVPSKEVRLHRNAYEPMAF